MKNLFVLLIILFSFSVETCEAKETLTIALGGIDEKQHPYRIGNNLLQEIAKKLDVNIHLITLPPKRATRMLQNGEIHAELSRIASYQEKVPTSIKVEEPIASMPFHVYTHSKKITVDGWDSLKQYKVVYIRGRIFLETHLKNNNSHAVDSAMAAFHFLKAERADVYVGDALGATEILNSPEFIEQNIIKLEPPIAFMETFTFFSSKYSDLARRYNKALIEIKKEGVYKRIFLETQ